MSKVRVGIIGVGGISVNRHIPELLKVNECEITALCDINEAALERAKEKFGLKNVKCFTDYKDLINCPEVDAVEVCTPNHLHVPFAIEAVKAGKPVNVEKPLSIDLAHAAPLAEALKENPVPNMMCFTYRFYPAVRFAKWIMDKGMLGQIVSINVEYLKSSAFMEGRRLEWRFVKEYAGTGVLGDLGVHLFDMAELLCGKMKSLTASTSIVIKERPLLNGDGIGKVETDDYCSCLAKMENGADASFTISRCAIGNANTIKYEVYGTDGVISFNLNNPNVIAICIGEIDKKADGLHTVNVPNEFKITQEQTFINMINGKPGDFLPTVADGMRSQMLLDKMAQASEEKRWIDLD